MSAFNTTVGAIENYRNTNRWPNPSVARLEETCDACDLRWNCGAARTYGRNYGMIYP
jgi:hypothetical protein